MARINLVMQGKGGVGKSVVASLFTQYLRDECGRLPIGIDTDPINSSFSKYAALGAHCVGLLDERRAIDLRNFDQLLLHVDEAEPGQQVVVDSGASTFISLTTYLDEGEVPTVLAANGHELVVHTVVAGGQEQNDTLGGLAYLLRTFGDAGVVVWLNHFHGQVRRDGCEFRKMTIYLENQHRIRHVVDLPRTHDLISQDLSRMFSDNLTFQEAIGDPTRDVYVTQRLVVAKRRFYQAIEESGVAIGVS